MDDCKNLNESFLYQFFLHKNFLRDKEFLVTKEKNYSFREIYQEALKLSFKLKKLGLKKFDRVALCFFNTPDFVIIYFALILNGSVSVCLSPLLKAAEREKIYKHAQVRFSLVDPSQKVLDYEFTNIEELIKSERFSSGFSLAKEEVPKLTELISLIYTSGSTGQPKAVMLTRQNIEAQVSFAGEVLKISPSDRILGVLSFVHVFGQMNVLLSSFFYKNSICLIEKFTPKKSLEALRKEQISVIVAVPSMYESLLKELERQEKKTKKKLKFSNLRLCHTGGSYLREELQIKIEKKFKVKVQQGYGLTETCSMAFSNPLGKNKYKSVGLLIHESLDFQILDSKSGKFIKEPLKVGEVLISGAIITPGYFKNPRLTEESFYQKYLKTGDLGYFDQDFYLYLVGRKKELIIRHGAKIYPLEIEEIIAKVPKIKEVAVIGVKKSPDQEITRAFLVLEESVDKNSYTESTLIREIRLFCLKNLAQYKIPNEFVFLERLPKTSSGKINKQALFLI